jgi:hypothetical protein
MYLNIEAERYKNVCTSIYEKYKGKLKLPLCLMMYHAFLSLALDGGEWSASCLGRFTPRKKAPFTH